MFTINHNETFVALPVESGDDIIEVGFDIVPYIICNNIDVVYWKVLTLQEVRDLIDALTEVKKRME